jgi:hypothetical protein
MTSSDEPTNNYSGDLIKLVCLMLSYFIILVVMDVLYCHYRR